MLILLMIGLLTQQQYTRSYALVVSFDAAKWRSSISISPNCQLSCQVQVPFSTTSRFNIAHGTMTHKFKTAIAAAPSSTPTSSYPISTNIRQNYDNSNRILAKQYVKDGMNAFRFDGDVKKSIEYFNLAEQTDPNISPYLWQRGLSYYYNEQYDLASEQFRIDVKVNPYDVEEIVWDIASQAQLFNVGTNGKRIQEALMVIPIPNQLSLPPGTDDRRKIMGYVYRLFRGEGTEQELAVAGHAKDASLADEFYALFYLSLYNEILNRSTIAELYLRQALSTLYGRQSNDYMVSCAKIQATLRKWT